MKEGMTPGHCMKITEEKKLMENLRREGEEG